MSLDLNKIKNDFPIFAAQQRDNKPLVYLDSGATTQKPQVVIDSLKDFYSNDYGTVHRGIYNLSAVATEKYEAVRKQIAKFINCNNPKEIIFTRGTTESINMVARSWGETFLKEGDEIILSDFEHHSNMVPWLMLQEKIGVKLTILDSTSDWQFDIDKLQETISNKTKLVAISGMSNVLGTIPDLSAICDISHSKDALVLVDGAQLAPHHGFDIKNTNCDFLAFSSHKMLGPTGIGVLYVREEIAEEMTPFLGGGDMIEFVEYDSFTTNELPYKFEAGTPNISGVIGFGAAIDYLDSIGMENIREHEANITAYALEKILSHNGMKLYGSHEPEKRGAIFSFNYKDIHSHDVASILDFENIAIRAGHHCAQPLMNKLGVNSTVRASFYIYNNHDEIDILLDKLAISERFLTNAVR